MKRAPRLFTALLFLLAGSCGKPDTRDWFKSDVVATSDGAVLIWRRDLNQHTRRLWMDHGSESLTVESEFHAFRSAPDPDGGFATRPLAMDYRWRLGENQMRQSPSALISGERVIAHACHRLADIVSIDPVRCDERALPVYRQVGTRGEALYRQGSSLIFAAGLDGRRRPCTVSLAEVEPEPLEPFGRLQHFSGGEVARDATGRFAVSYLPPRTAYIADHAGDGIPLYLVGCGGLRKIGPLLASPALATLANDEKFREFVDIVDIVPTEDPDDPAVLLTWRVDDAEAGFGQAYAVLSPKQGLKRLPTEVEEKLGFDGGLCMCTAFWAGDPNRILLDVFAHGEKGRAEVRFVIFDLKQMRVIELRTSYPLS